MTTYFELFERVLKIAEDQQKRLDQLHEMILDLAKNGVVYKHMLIDVAKKVGLDAQTLEKIRKVEDDYRIAKSKLKKTQTL